jgi:DNA-directed RNA polymerase specialized sigma24 family protein
MGSRRKRDDRLKDHPLLVYFGALCDPLSNEQAQQADFVTRIESIGRFLVREVLRFHRRLSPQGRINYDPEDILIEVWIELRRRNHKYDPARGGYRTFAVRIMRNTFLAISERSRCVRLPSNSAALFNAASNASLDDAARKKFETVSRAAKDHADVTPHTPLLQDRRPSPVDGLIWMEDFERLNTDVADRIGALDTYECIAIGATMRLWGTPKQTLAEAAQEYGVEPGVLRRALRSARSKLATGE